MIRTIKNDLFTVSANEQGAELYSVQSADGTEYLWQGVAPYWSGRAINIFPVCGRLAENRYTYRGKSYDMKCHGLASKFPFVLSDKSTDTKLVFELVANDETREQYPFDFKLEISYELCGNKLICTNTTTNLGDDILPFTTGAHPGFNVPLTEGLSYNDYYIDFGDVGALSQLNLTETCYRTKQPNIKYPLRDGKYLDLEHSLFDHDAIFFEKAPKTAVLRSDKDTKSVKVSCDQANFFGLWHTNRSDAPFICLEPLMGVQSFDGVVDDFDTKDYMTRIAPGESSSFTYEITFN